MSRCTKFVLRAYSSMCCFRDESDAEQETARVDTSQKSPEPDKHKLENG